MRLPPRKQHQIPMLSRALAKPRANLKTMRPPHHKSDHPPKLANKGLPRTRKYLLRQKRRHKKRRQSRQSQKNLQKPVHQKSLRSKLVHRRATSHISLPQLRQPRQRPTNPVNPKRSLINLTKSLQLDPSQTMRATKGSTKRLVRLRKTRLTTTAHRTLARIISTCPANASTPPIACLDRR